MSVVLSHPTCGVLLQLPWETNRGAAEDEGRAVRRVMAPALGMTSQGGTPHGRKDGMIILG